MAYACNPSSQQAEADSFWEVEVSLVWAIQDGIHSETVSDKQTDRQADRLTVRGRWACEFETSLVYIVSFRTASTMKSFFF